MEANELRIGNLVGLEDSEWNGFNQFFEFMENSEVKSFLDDKNKYAIVKTIADEVELMAYGVDLDFYSYKEIQPIPLTEDWLIRFGFELLPWGWVKKSDTGTSLRITTHHYFAREGNSSIKIESIHQLQNLYFALTGTELTLKN